MISKGGGKVRLGLGLGSQGPAPDCNGFGSGWGARVLGRTSLVLGWGAKGPGPDLLGFGSRAKGPGQEWLGFGLGRQAS